MFKGFFHKLHLSPIHRPYIWNHHRLLEQGPQASRFSLLHGPSDKTFFTYTVDMAYILFVGKYFQFIAACSNI